jgi:hypothetical protein
MHRLGIQQPGHDPALAGAESLFAIALEDLADRAAGGFFDFRVGVDKGNVEARCHATPDRRLAGTHQAHENKGFRQNKCFCFFHEQGFPAATGTSSINQTSGPLRRALQIITLPQDCHSQWLA